MYPFNSNVHNNIFDTGQTVPNSPFIINDINGNSKLEDHDSSLFHFPSPYIHYEDDTIFLQHLHDFLLQQQQLTTDDTVVDVENTIDMDVSDNK